MPSPLVLVNGSSPPYQATAAQNITVTLVNPAGVTFLSIIVVSTDDSAPTPPIVTVDQSTYTGTFTMTGVGTALLMQCTVNNGRDILGVFHPEYTFRFKVHVLNASAGEVYALGEKLESGPYGWLPGLNRGGGGGGGYAPYTVQSI